MQTFGELLKWRTKKKSLLSLACAIMFPSHTAHSLADVDKKILLNQVTEIVSKWPENELPRTATELKAIADRMSVQFEMYDAKTKKILIDSDFSDTREIIMITYNSKTKLIEMILNLDMFHQHRTCEKCGMYLCEILFRETFFITSN